MRHIRLVQLQVRLGVRGNVGERIDHVKVHLLEVGLQQRKQRVQHRRRRHLAVRVERSRHVVEHGGDLDNHLGGDRRLDEVNHLLEQALVDQARLDEVVDRQTPQYGECVQRRVGQ